MYSSLKTLRLDESRILGFTATFTTAFEYSSGQKTEIPGVVIGYSNRLPDNC